MSVDVKKFLFIILCCAVSCQIASAQDEAEETAMPIFSRKHGIVSRAFSLQIRPSVTGRKVYYTLDGSMPTRQSKEATRSFTVQKTSVVRAVEEINDTLLSPATTATYIFLDDVLTQCTDANGNPVIPSGYPDRWGKNVDISGYAPAFYAMDNEIASESATEIKQGLKDLPIISLVTERDYFFNTEYDEERGGIYVFTGAPVGDGIGRGWERPVSLEIMGGKLAHDVTVDCGIKIHGGHSRVPEKNAKHAFRLMFKSKYGVSKLRHAVYGDEGVDAYEDLILRTNHSNSWLHWSESDRQRSQYTRDQWAHATQERMGWPVSKEQPVHVFINGLYWGIYNLTERITAEHCKRHYGGKEADYDVLKVDETAGEKVVAEDGDLEAWQQMLALVEEVKASSNTAYYALQGLDRTQQPDASLTPLLDMDNFIDYMLINFYAGNTDWDHHNWFAFRNRVEPGRGFRFICWDTELIFVGVNDNVTTKDNAGKPSHILNCLMRNNKFKRRFNHRAHLLLDQEDGLLTPEGVVAVWDSLYEQVKYAVYDESARWGVYRRNIQPYQSKGHRYRVDPYFLNERNRLLTSYFPQRTAVLRDQLKALGWYTAVDNYVDGVEEILLTDEMEMATVDVYDMQGRKCGVLQDNGQLPTHLPPGVYVVNGRKTVVR